MMSLSYLFYIKYMLWHCNFSDAIRYANNVHLSAVLENTALVQGIKCEPSGEHLVPWTCAVFFQTARKWTPFDFFSHDCRQYLYKMYTCSTTECGIGWYRYTSHSKNKTLHWTSVYISCDFTWAYSFEFTASFFHLKFRGIGPVGP